MKLLTLNTHSLIENDYKRKLYEFVSAIAVEKPDIIALQEVNQSFRKAALINFDDCGYFPCDKKTVIRKDNHVYNAAILLRENGINYYWTWLPIKIGYNMYDEGIALMSRSPVISAKILTVSEKDNYYSWKTRKLLGINTENNPEEWFFSVHYGWWNDEEDPFRNQWSNTLKDLPNAERIWLMGDFNCPSRIQGEGYDLISSTGWYDSYYSAEIKDNGITVKKEIDGWKNDIPFDEGIRIDYIWSNKKVNVSSSEVVFNDKVYPVVSDHFGVMINTKGTDNEKKCRNITGNFKSSI